MLTNVMANSDKAIVRQAVRIAEWTLRDAIYKLRALKYFPPEKENHALFNAVHTPIPVLGEPLWTDDQDVKWHSEEAEIEVSKLVTRQRYIYHGKAHWYITHPAQIEIPQLHKETWWLLATVYHVDDVWLVGNGNHRVSAALLMGWPKIKVRLLTPEVMR